jgi:hypothetical protein
MGPELPVHICSAELTLYRQVNCFLTYEDCWYSDPVPEQARPAQGEGGHL